LADSIKAQLAAISEHQSTSAADRDGLKSLAMDPELTAKKINAFLSRSTLAGTADAPGEDRRTLMILAAQLSEEHKWLTPRQLEDATVSTEPGGSTKVPFDTWFREVVMKKRKADASPTGQVRLSEIEKRVYEVGTRLLHYRALRDRDMRSVEPLLVMPRPSNADYLAFLGKVYERAQKTQSTDGLTLFELDGAKALDTYWNELPRDERATPGTDPKFDKPFVSWLSESSAWVPLRAILDAKPEDLANAGFPAEKMAAFLTAFKDLESAEDAAPGRVDVIKSSALVAAARALGESASPASYPTVSAIDREAYFNDTNPFFKAPAAYGFAVMLLAIALGFRGFERKSFLGAFGRFTHVAGVVALLAGIVLEAIGFYLRVRISGWAPVTNMYETVIWVSVIAAVLGFVFESIYRNTYAGLAGAGTALLGTILAANVPLLDPDIHTLQPVLRSNYWLTIHVLTEVSSYGAFLMAAMLGLIGTGYYLTATYRRSPSYLELALPLVPGLPLLAVGSAGVFAAYGELGPTWVVSDAMFYLSVVLVWIGEVATIGAIASMLGEAVARMRFHPGATLDTASAVDAYATAASAPAATVVETVYAAEGEGSGAVATLTKPSVAEIRAKALASMPTRDARGIAMQETAARIKPLSNVIYRTMQVGVLLIAGGTFLGGWWADKSWGRFWGWDPKEVWALITLLVYLVPLHGRFAGWFNMFALVVASVVCSMSVIMAWYGVNFVLGVGLHSYGFTEGGGQGIVWSTCLAVLALPLAAAWRRQLGSKVATAG
jgi:ABC-type transport system involved in cytochrome c biogenesis permease subunit